MQITFKKGKTKTKRINMNHSYSTNEASKKLQEDLGLDYGLGKKIVSQFFNQVDNFGYTTYWEPKANYQYLLSINETIKQVKERVKNKVNKHWFKGQGGKNAIEQILPEKEDRKKLYIKIFQEREKRGGYRLPNQVILEILVKELGHFNKENKGLKVHWFIVGIYSLLFICIKLIFF